LKIASRKGYSLTRTMAPARGPTHKAGESRIRSSRPGALTVGRDVRDAYNKMEKVEHTARVVLTARLQGPITPLSASEVEKLRRLGEKHKAGG
jgi:ribulose-5-phosphate 4-epimerase/fuculose-1-phosphate aldolase